MGVLSASSRFVLCLGCCFVPVSVPAPALWDLRAQPHGNGEQTRLFGPGFAGFAGFAGFDRFACLAFGPLSRHSETQPRLARTLPRIVSYVQREVLGMYVHMYLLIQQNFRQCEILKSSPPGRHSPSHHNESGRKRPNRGR